MCSGKKWITQEDRPRVFGKMWITQEDRPRVLMRGKSDRMGAVDFGVNGEELRDE